MKNKRIILNERFTSYKWSSSLKRNDNNYGKMVRYTALTTNTCTSIQASMITYFSSIINLKQTQQIKINLIRFITARITTRHYTILENADVHVCYMYIMVLCRREMKNDCEATHANKTYLL